MRVQTQGSLLRETSIFSEYEWVDMERINRDLDVSLNTYRPLQLLFIIRKIKNIGG